MPTGKALPESAPSTNEATEIPPIISVDDHIVEPPTDHINDGIIRALTDTHNAIAGFEISF